VFAVTIQYPQIANIDVAGEIKADAKLKTDVQFTTATLYWGYNAPATNASAVPINGVDELWLSDIVGSSAPLSGHSGLIDVWNLKLVLNGEAAPTTFNLDIEAHARLDYVDPTSQPAGGGFYYPVVNIGGSTQTWQAMNPSVDILSADYNYADDDFTLTTVDCQISGKYEYYGDILVNPSSGGINPLNLVTVKLMDGTTVIASTTTLADGSYLFTSVPSGTFDVVATTVKPVAGAINSTDAGQVSSWFNNTPLSIERIKWLSGDVNGNLATTSGDAAQILTYFVTSGTGTSFASNWVFWKSGETIDNNPWSYGTYPQVTVPPATPLVTQDFYGLVTGDFNRSFAPSTLVKKTLNLALQDGIDRPVGPSTTVLLPISVVNSYTVGAASIILEYPADKLDILNVFLGNDPNNPVMFNADNGVLRIGWTDLNALNLTAGQALVTMEVRTSNSINTDEPIRFTLAPDPLNELADGANQVIFNGVIKIDVLNGKTVGIPEGDLGSQLALANYPNPFANHTTFAYSLPVKGDVTLEIYDLIGQKIATVVNTDQAAGQYTIDLDGSQLTVGVYMATLRLEAEGKILTRTIRIISH
jgi:hypothetical protein